MRPNFSDKKRIVIKIGSSSLTYPTGLINIRRIEAFVQVLADLKNSGLELVLVSSGAQAVGMGKLGLKEKPRDIPSKQALAAIGQCELMHIYDRLFTTFHHTVAQVLLTKDVIETEEPRVNAINTLSKLLEQGCIPILNENDTVSYEEIEIGDNDTLSAVVGGLIKADLLIILTDIDGLYDKPPKDFPDAKIISYVDELSEEIMALGGGSGSALGTGGMHTKLSAAKIAGSYGCDTVILSGSDPSLLYDLLEGRDVGTFIRGSSSAL